MDLFRHFIDEMVDWWTGIGCLLAIPVVTALLTRAYNRFTMGHCKSRNRLDGKVVIITGCNAGIGKETARVLAGRGARVIMACRDIKKAEEAAKSIRESRPKSNIAVMHLDLCSLSSVRSFAHRILEHEERLDILLNNAGISGGKFKLTEDGFEEIYQANYLGPFYLTELLMPLLKKSAPARILNVGSTAYLMGSVSLRTFLEDIRRMNTTSGARYGDSKLAMLMWTKAIAKELEDSGVTVNCLHPGVVSTTIAQRSLNLSNLLFRINIFVFGRTAEEGAQTLLHLCLDPAGGEKSGEFWMECRPAYIFRRVDPTRNERLLELTRKTLGLQG